MPVPTEGRTTREVGAWTSWLRRLGSWNPEVPRLPERKLVSAKTKP